MGSRVQEVRFRGLIYQSDVKNVNFRGVIAKIGYFRLTLTSKTHLWPIFIDNAMRIVS